MRARRTCLALLLAFSTACQTAASFNRMFALDGEGRVTGKLLEIPPLSFASGGALQPAGQRIAFVLTSGNVTGAAAPNGFSSDICFVKGDGSGLRKVVEHEQENIFSRDRRLIPPGASSISSGAPR